MWERVIHCMLSSYYRLKAKSNKMNGLKIKGEQPDNRQLFYSRHYIRMLMAALIDLTIQRVGLAVHALELKSRMSDIVTMKNNLIDLALNICALTDGQVIGQDMSRHGTQVLGKTPHMQVMDPQHPFDLFNIGYHGLHVYIPRCGLEQDPNRLTQDPPGTV